MGEITKTPKQKLSVSQMITTGAKNMAILVVPNGCIKKRSTRIAQLVPTIVALVISSFTIERLGDISGSSDLRRGSLPLDSSEDRLRRCQDTV